MAKEQNLSLSPTKISGLCGRLMCCLKYEQECYEDARKRMPKVGREVITPDGTGTVVENNLLRERVKVKVLLPDGTFDLREYPLADIKRMEPPQQETAPAESAAEDIDLAEALDLPELEGE